MPVTTQRIANVQTITTNAVANTLTVTTLLAAPGAGLTYRIFWISIAKVDMAAGPKGASLASRILGGNDVGGLSLSTTQHSDFDSLEPYGFRAGNNIPITWTHVCDIASLLVRTMVIYSLESA